MNVSRVRTFDWVMETRYPISRILRTLPGTFAGLILLETVVQLIQGPRDQGCYGRYRCMSGFSWWDTHPFLSFLTGVLWSSLAFGGSLLMWYVPRLGYFCAGMGYQLYLTLMLMDWISSPYVDRGLNASGWVLRLFALPVWLFWLCVKDEPSKRLWLGYAPGSTGR